MRRGNRVSSRQRFFKQHTFGDEHADVLEDQQNDGRNSNDESLNDSVLSLTESQSTPIHGSTSDENANTIVKRCANRMTSRKRFFRDLQNEETTMYTHTLEDDDAHAFKQLNAKNALQSESSFGQAHYQRQNQGIIIEYKDFGDNAFQCVHCNACYWRDEKNTRGIYTGCCKGGQVRLQLSNPTPPFLEYLLDSNNGAKSKHFRENIRVYNSMFAFTSMGADIVKDINKNGSGPYVFKICGQVHHLMGSISPKNLHNYMFMILKMKYQIVSML
uniref:uncharacterized protein LOC105352611 n=1 Tax=Fragaria vesca subsp. vesca TaxID=101020 RepID=UPI0005C9EF7E|nr:PREDICTED: uncharacterized protein LOC105352611 [Fragaria vesca subsp. vesca]